MQPAYFELKNNKLILVREKSSREKLLVLLNCFSYLINLTLQFYVLNNRYKRLK